MSFEDSKQDNAEEKERPTPGIVAHVVTLMNNNSNG